MSLFSLYIHSISKHLGCDLSLYALEAGLLGHISLLNGYFWRKIAYVEAKTDVKQLLFM